ncbi:MAG: T9SS type A sorting domain-containing protein [Sphingobacteriales bacterium]|nr:T9SS type A sorting domain-containing protein [Sphingobacteriales bacterium]MBI3718822.1 T9SS type A sorting domain-containing protein [Sphingobacteriales bacterium]
MNIAKRLLVWAFFLLLIIDTDAQITTDTLKVVNWNLNWFGSSSNGPSDDNLQEANVQTIIQNLNADVYALVEIVSINRLQNIVSSLPGYDFVVSDFCSGGNSVSSCATAQKLAFVYRTSRVNKIKVYGVLRAGGSSGAYTNWASGRFPYLMEADVTINNTTKRIVFIAVHAKANTGSTNEKINSYYRRQDGIAEVRDSLNLQYSSSNFILLGDYNDDLDQTITTEMTPITASSYNPVLNQPDKYIPVTLPLSLAGQNSTVNYPDVIDHVTLSNEMNSYYVANSAKILKTEAESWITNYGTTTSDHYPVQTKYFFNSTVTGVNDLISSSGLSVKAFGTGGNLNVQITSTFAAECNLQLIDLNGRILKQTQTKIFNGTTTSSMNTANLANGIYLLRVSNAKGSVTQKLFIQR